MESPDYASSPDATPNPPKSPSPDDREKTSYIRFLISNAEAGSIIGKGGSTITEFQSLTGARIQLSRNQEFFPGTSDRIIMISGSVEEVLNATELVQKKLLDELQAQAEEGVEADEKLRLRVIVPNSSCGAIIGKGGSTIKSFQEDSHAGIKISPQDNLYMGVNDRLLTISGSLEELMKALFLVMSKLTEDPHYSQMVSTPFSYAGSYNYGSNGMGGYYYQNNKGLVSPSGAKPYDEDRNNSLTIAVADEHIGAVVGRGGRNIMEISQATGAKIKISDRGDFMAGTSDRKVTITGSQKAIHSAELMIMNKVSVSAERA